MSVKQIKWHVAVLTVTVFAALTVLFALATVTSNAATSYDPETRTYTMTGGTYDQKIVLERNTTTTIVVSGENKLTFDTGVSYAECITGEGNLIIKGNGSLATSENTIHCNDLTIIDGATLKIDKNVYTYGKVTVENAGIESDNGYMSCAGSFLGESRPVHIFNNAQLRFTGKISTSGYINAGLILFGGAVLTDCNATFENARLYCQEKELNIIGGTYNFIQTSTTNSGSLLGASPRLKTNNTVIKSDNSLQIMNLEMTDSTLEITVPPAPAGSGGTGSAALEGENLVFSGSDLNIDTPYGYTGIYANSQLIMAENTEANVRGMNYGIVSKNVLIIHSGGKFQATGSHPAAAVAGIIWDTIGPDQTDYSGTITLNSVNVKEPDGGTVRKAKDPTSPGGEFLIAAIAAGDAPATTVTLEADHRWDAGKVTKEPTATEEGVKTYTCGSCGATKTEAIPKLAPQDSQAPAAGADGTPFGKGASVAAAEAAILALPNDNDPAGTAFGLLQLKATKVTKNSIRLTWKAVPGATKYILFANKCGTGNKYKKLGEVTGTSFTATQAAGAAIQKGTYYKFMMIAADSSGKVVSTSKTVHAATKGGKIGNHKKVTVKKSVTKKAKKLKKGKTLKLKAKAVPQTKKLKVRKHRGIMYETSNPAVAQVNGKGTVKGVGKGTCYIYAYAQNGTCAKVKVTVK